MSTDSIDPEIPDESVSFEQVPPDGVPAFPTLEEMAALLPQYEFHDVLGVGGMGAVYLGRQATLDRWVAIKVLPQSASMNEEDANRFIIEARSMAKLSHAHIVAVYDFGQTSQGHLYLVMEHIDGLDLHRLIHRDEVTQARIRSLVPQLCDALQYAHDHDVIHRDIKPANILITSDWQAKIVDFGLARDKNADSSGEVEYGTPDYVAPERLQTGATVDHRADIYALGVVIHEMFTKRTPMAAGANVGQGVPADYYSAVKRCTMTDPVQRFQKCSEIKSFLAIAAATSAAPSSAPVHRPAAHAAPPRPAIRQPIDTGPQESASARWAWAAAVVALLSLAGWFLAKNRESEPASPVVAESKEAQPKKADKDNTPDAPVVTQSKESAPPAPKTPETVVPGDMPTAQEATVVTSGPVGPFKVTPGDFSVLKRLTGNSRTVFGSALLPDQRHAIAGGSDLVLRIWDIATSKETKSFRSPIGEISNIIPAADGKRVLIYSLIEDQVCIFDIENGKSESLLKAPSSALSHAVWSPDEKSVYLACSNQDSGVYYWDPAKGAVLQQFADWQRPSQQMFPLSAKSTGAGDQMLVLGYSMKPSTSPNAPAGSRMIDRTYAALFSMPDHRFIRELPAYNRNHNRLNLSPDGTTLAGGTTAVYLMDLPELATRSSIVPPRASFCQSSAFLADGRLLIAGYSDGSLRLHETETGAELSSLNLESRANRIAVSKDEGWLVISGFSMNSKEAKPEDYDLRVVRLPDLTRLGSEKGYLAFASRQLAKLDEIDPELAALRKKLTPADAITSAKDMKARVLDLNAKYAAALRRDAQRASPADQLAMIAEADAIAAGQPMPDPVADASVTGEMKRFRGLYRQQISQLDTSRQQSASALKSALEAPIREISNKRSQAGDRLGSARALALLASLDHSPSTSPVPTAVAAASIPSTTTSPTPSPAASSAAPASPARLLQRTGKPGTLVKVDRVVKNYYSSDPPRITNIPPDLGPVLEVACSRYHVIALKPDGTLRSWGTWSDRTTAHTIPDTAKDVVSIVATDSSNAALLATGKVVVWSENNNSIWTPPNGMTVTALRKGGSYHNFAICSDGSLHAVTTYSLNDSDAIPSGMTDIADATGYSSNGYFAVKKDGTMAHWGKTNIYIGETHSTVKDAVAVAEGNGFLAVIHRDGTIDGWGEASGRQRFRTRKYPGASRILGDPDNRLFFVLKPGNEWAALPNPSVSEYLEEERLSVLEGKLKGCTCVAVAEWVVFGVKP